MKDDLKSHATIKFHKGFQTSSIVKKNKKADLESKKRKLEKTS
jgi:hypothetical protein